MHGLGNDFVLTDLRRHPQWQKLLCQPAWVRFVCNRHLGVGADGILALSAATTKGALATMTIHNADGSLAEMCGNGLRCVARYLVEPIEHPPQGPSNPSASSVFVVDTLAGPRVCKIESPVGQTALSVAVDMGRPVFSAPATIELDLGDGRLPGPGTLVSMGNPHVVFFVEPPVAFEQLLALAHRLGPVVETHPAFPHRTNVEFAQRLGATIFETVVWERGCGVTQACGTGACASVAAACQTGQVVPGQTFGVRLPGGWLDIAIEKDLSTTWLRGPAQTVFRGDLTTCSIMPFDGAGF